MHEELMKSFSGGNHGENMFSLGNDRLHENRTLIVFEKLLHFLSEVFLSRNTKRLDSHRFRKFDEVRIHLHCMCISFLVKNILPLLNHSIVRHIIYE